MLLIQFIYSENSTLSQDSLNVIHNVQEDISVTKLLDGKYLISVNGEVEIINPSFTDEIYEYRMRTSFPLGTLSGGFSVLNDVSSKLNERGFFGFFLEPSNLTYNSSLYASYSFSGVLSQSQFEKLQFDQDEEIFQISFLEAFTDPVYVIKPSFKIDKPIGEHEEQTVFNSKSGEYETIDLVNNVSTRAVSSKINNPTAFNMLGHRLEMIRTRTSDTFLENAESLGVKENFTILPYQTKEFGFYDYNSDSNSIYWVEMEARAMSEFFMNISVNYREQTVSPQTSSGGSRSSSLTVPPMVDEEDDFTQEDNLVITKSVDKFFVTKGEEITVTIRIINLGRNEFLNLSFRDTIPEGYSLVRVNNANIEGRTLNFLIDSVPAFSEFEIEYVLVKDSFPTHSFTFFPPVDFEGNAIVEGVLVLEDILGETNLFVQKEVTWLDSDFSKIRIRVRNVGTSRINNFKVLDELDENYLMREISRPFSDLRRGLWEVESLAPGGEWEVSYIAENHIGISQMPLVLGTDDSNVYTTVILNSHLSSTIQHSSSSIIERVGLGFAILLVLAYILF
ncbi:MAG: hypothetical protein ACMXYB_00745 [Candidatus Woesearchaeota archaeon]